jgi:putative heme iron utilization protein
MEEDAVSEDKLQSAIAKGAQAETLLRNDLLAEAFKVLETDYIKAWSATDPSQGEARENFWRAVQILGDVRRHLLKVANNGKIAQRELADLAERFRPHAE